MRRCVTISKSPVNKVKRAIDIKIVLTNWLTSEFDRITLTSNEAIEKIRR